MTNETNPNAKITAAIAKEIREQREAGKSLKTLGHEYGLSRAQISGICAGRFWADAGGPIVNRFRVSDEIKQAVIGSAKWMSRRQCAEKYGLSQSTVDNILFRNKAKNSK